MSTLLLLVLSQLVDRPPPLQLGGDPFFTFAPPSGAGLPSVAPLCSLLTDSEKVGNWFCQNGDGSMANGSTITLTSTGSPAQISQRICPNGPDCAAVTARQPISGSSGYIESATVDRSASITTGGFTSCWHGVVKDSATEQHLVALSTSGSPPWRSLLYVTAGGPTLSVYTSTAACGGTTSGFSSGLNFTYGAPHVVCVSWAASDGIYRTYMDGVAGAVSAAATTICGGGATSRFATAGLHAGSGALVAAPVGGYMIGAFDTQTQLSPARIAAIARAVLADTPTGSKGEVLVSTRASQGSFCPSSDGTGSQLPPGRPCVSGGLIRSLEARTNLALRAEQLNNAYWVKAGIGGSAAPTVTADFGIAPDGTPTADRVQFNACPTTADASIVSTPTLATPTSPLSGGIWGKSLSGSPSISVCIYGSAGGTRACAPKALVTTEWRLLAHNNQTIVTNADFSFGCENRTAVYTGGGASNTGAADVLLWGADINAAAEYVSGYTPTVASAAARAQDLLYVDLGATSPLRADNMSMSFTSSLLGINNSIAGTMSINSISLFDTSGVNAMWFFSSGGNANKCLATLGSITSTVPLVTTRARTWCASTSAGTNGNHNGTAISTASPPSATLGNVARYITIGGSPYPYSHSGFFGEICADPISSRCR